MQLRWYALRFEKQIIEGILLFLRLKLDHVEKELERVGRNLGELVKSQELMKSTGFWRRVLGIDSGGCEMMQCQFRLYLIKLDLTCIH